MGSTGPAVLICGQTDITSHAVDYKILPETRTNAEYEWDWLELVELYNSVH